MYDVTLEEKNNMTKRLTIALVAVALFVLMAVMPVSATIWANGTVINQGATIFIGEEGLNVTHALNQAYYRSITAVGTPVQNNSAPQLTVIGWWASAAVLYTTSPSRTIDLGVNRRYASMTVAPSDFVGYTGNWYLLDATASRPASAAGTDAAMVFSVQDPSLDLKIWDYNQNTDVTGKSVPQGEKLGFRIDTNMYPAVDGRYRSNVIDDSISGLWTLTPIWAGNNALIDSSYHWYNDTIHVTEGTCIVCANSFDVPVNEYYNYTSSGAWMTWSDGYGCNVGRSEIMYWNETNRDFQAYYGLGSPITSFTTSPYGNCNQIYPVAATDGYINIKIKDESNAQINKLYNQSVGDIALQPGPYSVLKNFVDNQPWFWGTGTAYPVHLNADSQPYDGNVWATGSLDGFNQYNYPVGTYTVCAESILNKMKDNYKQGGADYTGKTVSQCYTITLVSDSVKIEAN